MKLMEDEINGRWNQWKIKFMEEEINGRWN